MTTTVTLLPSPSVEIDTTSVSCPIGTNDGSIFLYVFGGSAPYDFLWGGSGSTSQECSGLAPGTYTATVTDANGCSTTVEATLAPPICFPPPSDTTIYLATCHPSEVGTKVDTLTGYLGQDSVVTTIVSFDSTLVPNIEVKSMTHPTEMNPWNGAIETETTGGTSNYTYVWSNGAVTEDVSGLQGGIYFVTVTDANGCIDSTRAGLCAFWVSNPLEGTAVIHFGPADQEVIDLYYGDKIGTLVVAVISSGEELLEKKIDLSVYTEITVDYSSKVPATATIYLQNGKTLFCKFVF